MAMESMAVPTEPLLEEKLRALEDYLRRLGGPGQRTICSLGSLEPGPPVKWYALAKKLQAALASQKENASYVLTVQNGKGALGNLTEHVLMENTMASVIRLYRIPY